MDYPILWHLLHERFKMKSSKRFASCQVNVLLPVFLPIILSPLLAAANGDIQGGLFNPSGTYPIAFGSVDVYDSVSAAHLMRISSDATGNFGAFNLAPGDYILKGFPNTGYSPYDMSLPETVSVITGDRTFINLFLKDAIATKRLDGQVVFAGTTAGVPDAMVMAWRVDGPGAINIPTGPAGDFLMDLPAGSWDLVATPAPPGVPWIFAGPPVSVDVGQFARLADLAESFGLTICGGCIADSDGDADIDGSDMANYIAPQPDAVVLDVVLPGAIISGKVMDEYGLDLADIPVKALAANGYSQGFAVTNSTGNFDLPVTAGIWSVTPLPETTQPFVYRQDSRSARVEVSGTMTHLDFSLEFAPAKIIGTAIDDVTSQEILDLEGMATVALDTGGDLTIFPPLISSEVFLNLRHEMESCTKCQLMCRPNTHTCPVNLWYPSHPVRRPKTSPFL